MNEPVWQYFNSDNSVVYREWSDGRTESCAVETIQDWLSEGNTPNPYVPPPEPAPLTPAEKLAAAGLTVTELKSLLGL